MSDDSTRLYIADWLGLIAMDPRDNLASRAVPQLLEKQGDTKLETRPVLSALRDKYNEKKGAEQPWQPGFGGIAPSD